MEVSYGSKSCTCTFEDIPHYGYRSKQDKQLRTARDSENFHAGAAAQILLFMEPDTACDFHVAPAPCARETHTGLRNPIVGLLTTKVRERIARSVVCSHYFTCLARMG